MFAKARRKSAESRFFLRALLQSSDADAVEFHFNAILHAGKSVLNAVHAQLLSNGLGALPSDPAKARSQAKATLQSSVKEWKRTVGPVSAMLFDALQEARDLEVHANDSATRQVPHTRERVIPHPVPPLGSAGRAAVVGMLVAGALSPEITLFESTFELKLDPAVPSSKRVKRLFNQFSAVKLRSTTETAAKYVELLESLVAFFESRTPPQESGRAA